MKKLSIITCGLVGLGFVTSTQASDLNVSSMTQQLQVAQIKSQVLAIDNQNQTLNVAKDAMTTHGKKVAKMDTTTHGKKVAKMDTTTHGKKVAKMDTTTHVNRIT